MKYYKFLRKGGMAPFAESFRWELPTNDSPGPWMPKIEGDLAMCQNGYHLTPWLGLPAWMSSELYEAEYLGEPLRDVLTWTEKIAVKEARLVRRVEAWNTEGAQTFARHCAAMVSPITPVEVSASKLLQTDLSKEKLELLETDLKYNWGFDMRAHIQEARSRRIPLHTANMYLYLVKVFLHPESAGTYAGVVAMNSREISREPRERREAQRNFFLELIGE
jgi:hypothetical protein